MNASIETINLQSLNLPKRVLQPIKQLIKLDAVKPEEIPIVELILSNLPQPDMLLPWLVHYRGLGLARGYFKDILDMAVTFNRLVNPWWSKKRWQEEHDSLSRLATLKTLAEENIVYENQLVRDLLPESFPGYVISSSRRLGMEGLRQRHCVASYHHLLVANQNSAIISMFVDKCRWTCEVYRRDYSETPYLDVTQVKGLLNQPASAKVIHKIKNALGIEESANAPCPEEVSADYHDQLTALLPILRDRGVASVRVEFDGSGDSGSIEDVNFDAPEGFNEKEVIDWPNVVKVWDSETRAFKFSETIEPTPLVEIVERVTEDWLESTGVDWYNNDGGYGHFEFDVENARYGLDVNVRYTESSVEYSDEFEVELSE
ncbi:DUF6878 family protein [Reinekea sp. G2M2-21]|uniref:DUF6878 family protein n=1 Tax=Reinekea sp. G2M2-21 TaxID=2788942 RepID=UPI0018A9CDDA|nr:DUF6878 family protein [Reinekea sp. G2M2-21]